MWKPTFCLLGVLSEAIIRVPSSLVMTVLLSRFFFLVLLCDAYFTKAEARACHAKGRAHQVDNWRGLFPRARVWRRRPRSAARDLVMLVQVQRSAAMTPEQRQRLRWDSVAQTIINSAVSPEHLITQVLSTPVEHLQTHLFPTTHWQGKKQGEKDRGRPCLPGGIAMETQCFHIPTQRRRLWIKTFSTSKAISRAEEALSVWCFIFYPFTKDGDVCCRQEY